MKKKFVFIRKEFWPAWWGSFLLMALFSLMVYAIMTGQGDSRIIVGAIFLPALVLFILTMTLIDHYNTLKVDENGIRVRNAFIQLRDISWEEVKGVYVYQFYRIDRLRVPYTSRIRHVRKYKKHGMYNLGGVRIVVPKKLPTKWIFIDDGRGENGENILEYFVPLVRGGIVRMECTERIFEAIRRNYQGEILGKYVEIREMY